MITDSQFLEIGRLAVVFNKADKALHVATVWLLQCPEVRVANLLVPEFYARKDELLRRVVKVLGSVYPDLKPLSDQLLETLQKCKEINSRRNALIHSEMVSVPLESGNIESFLSFKDEIVDADPSELRELSSEALHVSLHLVEQAFNLTKAVRELQEKRKLPGGRLV